MKKSSIIILLISFILCGGGTTARAYVIPVATTVGIYNSHAIPAGSLDENYENSSNLGLKAGVQIGRGSGSLGLELSLSNYIFTGKGTTEDLTIDSLALNASLILYSFERRLYPYASVGIGHYMPDRGSDGFGTSAGLGLITKISEKMFIDIVGNYHHIYNDSDGTAFFDIKAGLNFYFY